MAKGYTKIYGRDYQETSFPATKMNMVRALISLTANTDWPLKYFDMKNAFLNGNLEEEVCMVFPSGYNVSGSTRVCRLRKSFYGLSKHAMRGLTCLLK